MAEVIPPKKNMKAVKIVFWVTLVVLVGWFLLWFFHFRWREYTDDAYVAGNRILIKPQVSGSIAAYYADDNDYVKEGELLVRLDTTPFALDLELQKQELALAVRQARVLKEAIGERRSDLVVRKAALEKAQDDFNNRMAVVQAQAISVEEMEHADQDLKAAHAAYDAAAYQLQSAIAAFGDGPVEEHPSVLAQVEVVKRSYLNLWYCNILSPVNGYVAKRAAQVGDWAMPTATLMSVVPFDQVWVEANYKETQLKYVKVGQLVIITTDLYGSGTEFHGTVQGISSGTGSVFSLIPPQNATGNWIKIVQRLPVKILLDAHEVEKYPLRLGLSTETWVSLRDTSGSSVRPPAPRALVESTSIFDIDMEPIHVEINQIIQNNLMEQVSHNVSEDEAPKHSAASFYEALKKSSQPGFSVRRGMKGCSPSVHFMHFTADDPLSSFNRRLLQGRIWRDITVFLGPHKQLLYNGLFLPSVKEHRLWAKSVQTISKPE